MERADKIRKLYVEDGFSYKDLEKLGYNTSEISRVVKGIRSSSEAVKLARKQGKCELSEKGRRQLSENGKRAVKRNHKFWTKPERCFRKILNEVGVGVKFPEYVKEVFDVKDDSNPTVCHQYPIQRYVCDFVHLENRVVFRVQGDFWHANPILYNDLTDIQKHNVKQDKLCRNYLEKKGWHVCDIWESEIYWNVGLVKQKISPLTQLVSVPSLHDGSSRFESGEDYLEDWSERLQELWFKKGISRKQPQVIKVQCGYCKANFETNRKDRKFCSHDCYYKSCRKVERPSIEQLKNELELGMSFVALGKKYGVSDNAVRKWVRQGK